MKVRLNPNRSVSGNAALWLVLIVFVVAVIIIAWVAYEIISAIKRIVPPPPPGNGITLTVGSPLYGGVIVGYTATPPGGVPSKLVQPMNVTPWTLSIYAADVANPGEWTNCIFTTNCASWDEFNAFLNTLTLSNLTLMDVGSTNAPSRFFKTTYSPGGQ